MGSHSKHAPVLIAELQIISKTILYEARNNIFIVVQADNSRRLTVTFLMQNFVEGLIFHSCFISILDMNTANLYFFAVRNFTKFIAMYLFV